MFRNPFHKSGSVVRKSVSTSASEVDLIDLAEERAATPVMVDQLHAFEEGTGAPLAPTWTNTFEEQQAIGIALAGAAKELEGAAREVETHRAARDSSEQYARANWSSLIDATRRRVNVQDRLETFQRFVPLLSSAKRERAAAWIKPAIVAGDTAVLAAKTYELTGIMWMSILTGLAFGITAVAIGTKAGEEFGIELRRESRGPRPEGAPVEWTHPFFHRPDGSPPRPATKALYIALAAITGVMALSIWSKSITTLDPAGMLLALGTSLFAIVSVPGSAAVTAWATDPAVRARHQLDSDLATWNTQISELTAPFADAADAHQRANHAAWAGYERAHATLCALHTIADRRPNTPAVYGYDNPTPARERLFTAFRELTDLLPDPLADALRDDHHTLLTQLEAHPPTTNTTGINTTSIGTDTGAGTGDDFDWITVTPSERTNGTR